VGTQFHEDEVLEGRTEVRRARDKRAPPAQLVDDSDVEKPESRRLDDTTLRPLRPGRQPGCNERVHEDLEVAAHGVCRDPDLPGDRGRADDLAVRERSSLQESLKRGQVAGERFGHNFLPKIIADVGTQPRCEPLREIVTGLDFLYQGI
jgi:hypothetical protein